MYMGKIGQKSAAFINHKPFHVGSYRNLERVWQAENQHAASQRKQQELLEQRQQESNIEELRRAHYAGDQAANRGTQWVSENTTLGGDLPAHIARQITDAKLDWMYHRSPIHQQAADQEKYLLGEKAAPVARDEDVKRVKDLRSGHVAGSLMLGRGGPASNEDLMRKMREDPMFAIRQAEAQHKRAVQANPLLRAQDALEQEEREAAQLEKIERLERKVRKLKKKEKHRKRRQRRRESSDDDTGSASLASPRKKHKRSPSVDSNSSGDQLTKRPRLDDKEDSSVADRRPTKRNDSVEREYSPDRHRVSASPPRRHREWSRRIPSAVHREDHRREDRSLSPRERRRRSPSPSPTKRSRRRLSPSHIGRGATGEASIDAEFRSRRRDDFYSRRPDHHVKHRDARSYDIQRPGAIRGLRNHPSSGVGGRALSISDEERHEIEIGPDRAKAMTRVKPQGPQIPEDMAQGLRVAKQRREEEELGPPEEMIQSMQARRAQIEDAISAQRAPLPASETEAAGTSKSMSAEEMRCQAEALQEARRIKIARVNAMEAAVESVEAKRAHTNQMPPKLH